MKNTKFFHHGENISYCWLCSFAEWKCWVTLTRNIRDPQYRKTSPGCCWILQTRYLQYDWKATGSILIWFFVMMCDISLARSKQFLATASENSKTSSELFLLIFAISDLSDLCHLNSQSILVRSSWCFICHNSIKLSFLNINDKFFGALLSQEL